MVFGDFLTRVRERAPLVHNITNYVTVNDVANMILACGASPIMSDEPADVEEITALCQGLNINIGTLNKRTIDGMFAAGRKAKELGHATVLDPVGAGASGLRTRTAVGLMEEIGFDAIRGNISEIKTLAIGSGTTRGGGCRHGRCGDGGESGRRHFFCKSICEGIGQYCCDNRGYRPGKRREKLLCDPEWPAGDGKDHGNRLSVVRPGLCISGRKSAG